MKFLFLVLLLFSHTFYAQKFLSDSSFVRYSMVNIDESPKLKMALKKLHLIRLNYTKNYFINGDSIFTIIHIGDSHIQGDHFSGEIRKQLQSYFGNGGQGILFPYALAKSFGPRGTALTTQGVWKGLKTLTPNLSEKLGLTGYGAFTNDSNASISISFNEKFEDNFFNKVKIWHSSNPESFIPKLNNQFNLLENKTYSSGWGVSSYKSDSQFNNFTISCKANGNFQNHFGFYGFEISPLNARGIIYHHCGVVGSQFTHLINNATLTIEQIVNLKADLIIFSFGTNEAYNDAIDTNNYKLEVSNFLRKIEKSSPETAIIITTAPDTRSQGRIPTQQISVNNQLKSIVRNLNLSLFDLNEAMGGWGSLYDWHKNQLTLSDKLHFTASGYSLQGKLFTLSLLNAYNRVNHTDTLDISLLRHQVLESMTNVLKINKNDSLENDLKLKNKKPQLNFNKSKNKIHLIKKGETISMLSKIYHVSTKSIFAANHFNNKTVLQIGQKIIIPKK
jgi:LysM repeat protein